MKNILNIDNGIPTLLSNVDDGTNTLYINDELVPSSEWTGTGSYTFTNGGLTFTIQKIRDTSGNIMLQLIEQSGGTSYRLIKAISIDGKYYAVDDPAETDLADADYVPFYDTSAGAKKKTLWSNIVAKIKSALGIASSGDTFLKKDGTWGTPTDNTKVAKAGDTMTGTLNLGTTNNVALDFRPENNDHHTTASYQTTGNEALVLATKSAVTSFIFINGEDSITHHASNRWMSLVPGLQIKNNKVAIGKLIANTTDLTYPLEVNGDVQATNFRGALVGTASYASLLNYHLGNEINFRGNTPTNVYFNYRDAKSGSAAAVSAITYRFCNYSNDTSKTTLVAGTFLGTEGTFTGDVTIDKSNSAGKVVLSNTSSYGVIRLYKNTYDTSLKPGAPGSVTITLPSQSGTLALTSSSRRIKENIRDASEEDAQKILDIDVVKFDYKENWGDGGKNRIGFIAEDVQKILPEAVIVGKDYDPNLPVDVEYNFPPEMDYQRFIPYLVKMVQMQQEQINELKAEIKALKEG